MQPTHAVDARHAPRTLVFDDVLAALERRAPADRSFTLASARWAHAQLLARADAGVGPDGVLSPRVLKTRMLHLARQHTVLTSASVEAHRRLQRNGRVGRAGDDEVQQALTELLAGAARHPDWACERGTPTVDAAIRNLIDRANKRAINNRRREQRIAIVDQDSDTVFGAVADSIAQGCIDRDLLAFIEDQLPAADLAKWHRFRLWSDFGLEQAQVAAMCGMKPAALRKEVGRLRTKLADIIQEYLGDQAA